MDLVQKMIEAVEAAVVEQTGFKKLDISLGNVTNQRQDYSRAFSVKPTALEQLEGGVGFIFFQQGFEVTLYDKLDFRAASRQKTFDLYKELDKLMQKLYTVRVEGEGYQVVLIRDLASTEPVYSDNYTSLSVVFNATYRRQNLFRGA